MILVGTDQENPFGIVAPKSGRVKMISEILDSQVMPGIQGGPLMHVIAAKAVAFQEDLQPDYKQYCQQIIKNADTLAQRLVSHGYNLVSGGTDNHLMLVDLTETGISGKAAEKALEEAGITVNKNMVPFDTRSPFVTSGIRIGTPALTTRGMKGKEMEFIGNLIHRILSNKDDENMLTSIRGEIAEFAKDFLIYQDLI
jgi:glycine hydroxymethyltransferase